MHETRSFKSGVGFRVQGSSTPLPHSPAALLGGSWALLTPIYMSTHILLRGLIRWLCKVPLELGFRFWVLRFEVLGFRV